MVKEIMRIISLGENVNTEFKLAKTELPKSIFETVCSFLNTLGGYIILGVSDKREIVGIDKQYIDKMKKDFSSICNNKQAINPTIITKLNEIIINNKTLLYAKIDASNELHKYRDKIYIRNYEGDFDITNNIPLIVSIYNQKRKIYDEDEIFPYVSIKDLRSDLFDKCRKLANINVNKQHPWMEMSDLELLKSANLYKIDYEKGIEGITLAGVMLFGKNEIIRQINPYCRTDCLYRKDDLERYDDRDFVETNLLDMYDRLLEFIGKYTMDRFALDIGSKMRISPRNIMAREMVINTLMHRDIKDGHTSRIIIYKNKIVCENPNSFRTMQNINLENYTPFAKNPTLAKFFREIGYADELGSGVKKITENSILYSGKLPVFEDKEMFRLTIPLLRYDEELCNSIQNEPITSIQDKILKEIEKRNDISQQEIADNISIPLRTIKRNFRLLQENGYIERMGGNKNGHWHLIKIKDESGTINGTISGTTNGTINKYVDVNNIQDKILKEIEKRNDISQQEIADNIGVPLRTIKRNFRLLQQNGYIERMGGNKNGHWHLIKIKDESGTINGTISGTTNGTINKYVDVNNIQDKILKEIEKRNDISQQEIADNIGVPLRTIKRNFRLLQENGYIERIGGNKNGHWHLIKLK